MTREIHSTYYSKLVHKTLLKLFAFFIKWFANLKFFASGKPFFANRFFPTNSNPALSKKLYEQKKKNQTTWVFETNQRKLQHLSLWIFSRNRNRWLLLLSCHIFLKSFCMVYQKSRTQDPGPGTPKWNPRPRTSIWLGRNPGPRTLQVRPRSQGPQNVQMGQGTREPRSGNWKIYQPESLNTAVNLLIHYWKG